MDGAVWWGCQGTAPDVRLGVVACVHVPEHGCLGATWAGEKIRFWGGICLGNQKQPVDLLVLNGKTHLTQADIDERRSQEVKAPCDDIRQPSYLNSAQKKEFAYLSEQLVAIGIFSNLDTGVLARYCVAHSQYSRYTKFINSAPKKKAKRMRREAEERGDPISPEVSDIELAMELEKELVALQAVAFRQCEECAKALGLSVTSRCKLVVPQAKESPRKNKFDAFRKMG